LRLLGFWLAGYRIAASIPYRSVVYLSPLLECCLAREVIAVLAFVCIFGGVGLVSGLGLVDDV
jgi:hypothetical protein